MAPQRQKYPHPFLDNIDASLKQHLPFTEKIEARTKVAKTYIAFGIAAVASLMIFFDCAAAFVTNVIGIGKTEKSAVT